MIAEQRVDPSSGPLRLPFELAQQIDGLPRIGSAVGQVTGLNEHRLLSDPSVARVDQSGGTQDRHELVEGAVNVSDRHDALGCLDVAGKVGCCLPARLCGSAARAGRDDERQRHGDRDAEAEAAELVFDCG